MTTPEKNDNSTKQCLCPYEPKCPCKESNQSLNLEGILIIWVLVTGRALVSACCSLVLNHLGVSLGGIAVEIGCSNSIEE